MSNTTQSHPVHGFLVGLSPTLKTLTPYYLNLVKSKIFPTVQEYEMIMILNEEHKKKSHAVLYFTVPSKTYQNFNQNIIPNAVQNHQYLQEPRDMIPSTSHYLSSSAPSPQFVNSNAQSHAYVQVAKNIISPTTSYCSSSPPSPHLNQNMSLNASQNLDYIQGPKDMEVYTDTLK